MKRTVRPPAVLFGVAIEDLTLHETVERIGELVAEGRAKGRTHQIATVNVDFLVHALTNERDRTILQNADMCIPDGMQVVRSARMLGMPLRERVAGADLLPMLVDASQTNGHHIHMFGSTDDVAEAAEALLRERYPRARFSFDPGAEIEDPEVVDESVVSRIAAAGADILCVALGNPKQERFIAAHRDRLGIPVMIGIGGSLDLLVGKRRRAPMWAQRVGLEWAGRAMQEPRRLGARYARDVRIYIPALARHWHSSRRTRNDAEGFRIHVERGSVRVSLLGAGPADPQRWRDASRAVLKRGALVIDASQARVLGDPALAQLVGLLRLARRSGSGVSWEAVDPTFAAWAHSVGLATEGCRFHQVVRSPRPVAVAARS